MKPPYTHLTLDKCRELLRMRIAQRLSCYPSTLYREVKRNWFHDEKPLYCGSFHVVAQEMADSWRMRLCKLAPNQPLAAHVVDQLQATWSPEQIAGRLQLEPEAPDTISHETIDKFVYSSQGKALALFRCLPMARRQR
jgi:IS30 family transposase